MKETRNLSLSLYELMTNFVDVNKINNKALKFFIALALMPLLLLFAFLALFIEEPLKCIVSIILMRTTPMKALAYYKRCWGSFRGGYKYGN